MKRLCLDCGTPTSSSRCHACDRRRETRLYGAAHRARRAGLAPLVEAGQATCPLCGQQIVGAFDLDHGTGQPTHPTCNRAAGARGDG